MAQRYQREIEEILEKVNEDPSAEGGTKRATGRRREPQPKRPKRSGGLLFGSFGLSPGRLLIIGIVLLFAALFLNGTAFAAPAAWLGIGSLVAAYIMFFTRPRRSTERRWRGQVIEDQPEEGPLQRFWRWLTRG